MPAALLHSQSARLTLFAAVYTLLTLLGFCLMLGPAPLLISHWTQSRAVSAPDAPQQPPAAVNPATEDQPRQGVINLESGEQFKELMRSRDVILFFDCDWNIESKMWKQIFFGFAPWCRHNTDILPLCMKWPLEEGNGYRSRIYLDIRKVLQASGFESLVQPPHVFWLRNGKIVHWQHDPHGWTEKDLIHHTRIAFDPTYKAAQPLE